MSIFEAFMMITIVVGGGFALYKLGVFRDLKPHLTIDQNVTHRRIGEHYTHIAAKVILKNSSKVAVEINDAVFRIEQIAPLTDDEVEILYSELFNDHNVTDIQWPMLNEINKQWDRGEFIIEPSEIHTETYEFLISREIQSVVVYAYFHNSKYAVNDRAAEGWDVTSIHDIIDPTGGQK